MSTDPNHESRSLPCKVRGQITALLANLFFICSRLMLVQRREYEKKEKGTDEGWLLMARAIDNPLETLLRNRSCNGIAVLANSVTTSLDGIFTY